MQIKIIEVVNIIFSIHVQIDCLLYPVQYFKAERVPDQVYLQAHYIEKSTRLPQEPHSHAKPCHEALVNSFFFTDDQASRGLEICTY